MWYIKDGFFAKKVKGKKFLGLDLDRVIGDFLVKFGFATTEDCCEYFPVIPEIPETLITLTRIEALALIAADELIPGQSYKITGVDTALYGGTDIVLTAVTTSKFSLEGDGIFYNPKYLTATAGYGIWASTLTPTAGSTIIWGGMHWTNVAGLVGTATDKYTLSNAWTVIPYNTTDYNVVVDAITYDFSRNVILGRKDNYGNEVSFSPQYRVQILATSGAGHPIKAFQWGNSVGYNSNIGTQNNKVIESYFECLNFITYICFNNELESESRIYGNTFVANCGFYNNKLSNRSRIYSNTATSGAQGINNVTLDGDASINSNTGTVAISIAKLAMSSTISSNVFSEVGQIYIADLDRSSEIASNTIGGTINSNKIVGGRITSNTVPNGCSIGGNVILGGANGRISSNILSGGSSIGANTLTTSSYIFGNTLTNSSTIYENFLVSSNIQNITAESNVQYANNTLNHTTFDFISSGIQTNKRFSKVNAVSCGVINVDLSTATLIFDSTFTKTITVRQDGTPRLSYINNSDALVITAVTT